MLHPPMHTVNLSKDLVRPLPGLAADEDDRGVPEELELVMEPMDEGPCGARLLVGDRVPLVDEDHARSTLVHDHARELGVLLGHTDRRVDEQQADL